MSRKAQNHLDGILLVDKPAGWTSFDVVNFVRKRFLLDKTGHCGTLDPFATGLLVILLGKATRLQDSLMAQSKIYTGTIRLGEETDTGDLTGTLTTSHEVAAFSLEELQKTADSFLGDILQVPPMHSAIKINGQPLYKLARKGKEVERPARPVRIERFALSNLCLPEVDFDFDKFYEDIEKAFEKHPNVVIAVSEGVRTSDGTYVGESAQSGAVDVFGHKYLSGTGKALEIAVKAKFGCKVRSVEINLPQRCAAHLRSKTDIDESVMIGKSAVSFAVNGVSSDVEHSGKNRIYH